MKNFTPPAALFLFLALLFTDSQANAQHIKHCATSEILQESIKNDPGVQSALDQLNANHKAFAQGSSSASGQRAAKKIIPIVFHILHKYGEENITKAQVEAAVRVINEDFSKANSDLSNVVDEFTGIIADVELEFRLAKIDPNGNCTEGITRAESDYTFEGRNRALQSIDNWPRDQYVNVWVVHEIEEASGYATLPGTAGATRDGIVIRHTMMGTGGTAWGKPRTLTHEIGHFLGLYHIWGNGENGSTSNCGGNNDFISDTPETTGSPVGSCNLTQETCGTLDNVQNFMDYSTACRYMFTEGQKTRMQSALNSSAGDRSSLWKASNLVATGTNDGFNGGPCAPIADFNIKGNAICNGEDVTFEDVSYNGEVNEWSWSFPGGTPSTSTEQNPKIAYANPGVYDVSLTAKNAQGSDLTTRTNSIIVKKQGAASAPAIESMENTVFPKHPSDPHQDWIEEGTDWQRSITASATGNASMMIRQRFIDEGEVNSLITPSFDMTGIGSDQALKFKISYARRTTDNNDKLRVYLSRDCGKTWMVRYNRTGAQLATNGGDLVTGNYAPSSAGDWREETISLIPFAGDNELMFKFESTSGGGQTLYLDDINISGTPTSIDEENHEISSLNIFPNPFSNGTTINFSLKNSSKISITVVNIIGKIVGHTDLGTLQSGEQQYQLSEIAPEIGSGTYLIQLNTEKSVLSKKILKF